MPNNFRKTPFSGGYFVSKDGDDGTAVAYNGSNLETARDAPRKTLSGLSTGFNRNVIGAGYYVDFLADRNNNSFIGDGKVIFDNQTGSDLDAFEATASIGAENITLKNYKIRRSNRGVSLTNCTIINPILDSGATVITSETNNRTKCLIYSEDGTHSIRFDSAGGGDAKRDTNCTVYNVQSLIKYASTSGFCQYNAFVRNDGGICANISDTTTAGLIRDCAFKGQIIIASTTYTGFSDPQLAIDYPDFVNNQGNFELTQGVTDCFNNINQNDFSLKKESQLIKEGFTVGVLPFMFAKYAGVDPELTVGNGMSVNPATSSVGTTNIRVAGGQDFTELTSDWIQSTDTLGEEIEMGVLDLINQLAFDSDLSTVQPNNENVPVSEEYADGTAGSNPRRLTFEVRTSSKATKPTSDSDADNSFIVSAGSYINHEFNFEKLEFDNLQISKGDPTFDETLERLILRCAWFQVRVTLQDKL